MIKLVRDKLASVIPAHQLRLCKDGQEHLTLLVGRKLTEEGTEIVASNFSDASEYADALEVLMSAAELAGVDWGVIERVRQERAAARGRFLTGLVYNPNAPEPRTRLRRTKNR